MPRARARPRPLRLLRSLPGLPRHNSTTMDSGLSSAYSSAYSSAQSSAYSSLANTPRNEPSQAELKDAARDHRLAPSGRDHLSAVQHGARLPRRHEKRNRELKGRPRVRRTGGGSGGSGGSGSGGSGSSRGSPAGSPLRRHGSVVKFDDSLDELFEFEDRPYHNLDRASWTTPQYLPTGVNFINPQGRRRPLMRKRPQTPEERYAPVQDESSYSLSTRVKWKPSWSVIDSSLVSSGAATIRGRRGLEELRRMRERQSVRDAKAADEREVEADIVVKTSKVAQHLMHLRAQAKELDIQAQVDAWHARSPNKRLIGSGLFDVDVLGQNCFGLSQDDAPPQVYDMAPAPAPCHRLVEEHRPDLTQSSSGRAHQHQINRSQSTACSATARARRRPGPGYRVPWPGPSNA